MSGSPLISGGSGFGQALRVASSPSHHGGLLSSTPKKASTTTNTAGTPRTPLNNSMRRASEFSGSHADLPASTARTPTTLPAEAAPNLPEGSLPVAPQVPKHRFPSAAPSPKESSTPQPQPPTTTTTTTATTTSTNTATVITASSEPPAHPPSRGSSSVVGVLSANPSHSRTVSGTVLTPPSSRADSAAPSSRATPAPPPPPPPSTATSTAHTVPALSATSSGQAMLSNPLSLQATVLRHPIFARQTAVPELTEPGDILHDVLGDFLACQDEAGWAKLVTRSTSQNTGDANDDDDILLDEQIDAAAKAKKKKTTTTTAAAATSSGQYSSVEIEQRERLRRLTCDLRGVPYSHYGVLPVMTMPDTIGTYYTGETFRAFLSFYNAATYVLSGLLIKVDAIGQPDRRSTSLIRQNVATLHAKSTYACDARMPLELTGPYTLSVTVTYTDPSGESRRLVWASTVTVEQAITEYTHRTLRCLPLAPKRVPPSLSLAAAAMTAFVGAAPAASGVSSPKAGGGAAAAAAQPTMSLSAHQRQRHPFKHSHSGSNLFVGGQRVAQHTLEDALRDLALPLNKYALTIGLRNTARCPVSVTNVRLVLDDGAASAFTLLPSRYEHYCDGGPSLLADEPAVHATDAMTPLGALSTTAAPLVGGRQESFAESQISTGSFVQSLKAGGASALFASQYTGGGRDALRDLHMAPSDTRLYTFELLVQPSLLRRTVAMHHPQSDATATPTATATATSSAASARSLLTGPRSLIKLGWVEWSWVATNGDGADGRTSTISLRPLDALSDLELVVVAVVPCGGAGSGGAQADDDDDDDDQADSVSLTDARQSPCVLRAGEPVTVTCVLLHYNEHASLEASLKVRPEKLAPSWLYMGPAVIPLGDIKARSATSFSVTLIPCHAGWLTLAGGLEIVSSRSPDRVLWPLPPSSLADPGGFSNDSVTAVFSSAQSGTTQSFATSNGEALQATSSSSATRIAQQDYHSTFATIAETALSVERQPYPPVLYETLVM